MFGTRRRFLTLIGTTSIAGITGCSGDNTDENESPTIEPDQPQQVDTLAAGLEFGTRDLGEAVAVSNDSAIILVSDSGWEYDTGAAYVFEQSGSEWNHQQNLLAEDSRKGNNVAESLAISNDGSTAVLGAPSIGGADETPTERAGSAYIFKRSDGVWNQRAKLTADGSDDTDLFGIPVAVSGDASTAVVGAASSIYIFEQSNGEWNQQTILSPDDSNDEDRFGTGLAISGNGTTVIVGAPGEESSNRRRAGSAYVFAQSNGEWRQQTKLTASNDESAEQYGYSVAVSDDGKTAIVGANSGRNSTLDRAGVAFVFEKSDGIWSREEKLAPESVNGGSLESVTITDDGSTIAIGAPNGIPGEGEGSVFLFEQSNGVWNQQATLSPEDTDSKSIFGWSVTVSGDGDTTVVGAPSGSPPEEDKKGSAYVFQ